VTDPYGRILGFLGRYRYFFFQVAPHSTHEAEWTPFQTHYCSENLVAPGIEPGPLDLYPGTLTTFILQYLFFCFFVYRVLTGRRDDVDKIALFHTFVLQNYGPLFTVNLQSFLLLLLVHMYISSAAKSSRRMRTSKYNKFRGLNLQANYTDRATAACWRS
jgi:hypothetical protein